MDGLSLGPIPGRAGAMGTNACSQGLTSVEGLRTKAYL